MEKTPSQIKSGRSQKGVLLISAPWPLFNRPSIQLGVLKAHLQKKRPDMDVSARHCYLKIARDIGYERYDAISRSAWMAEAVYSALLFPGRAARAQKVFERRAKKAGIKPGTDFPALVRRAGRAADELIRDIEPGRFALAGFSVSLCQLSASLYFIRKIKKRFPDLCVAAGGASFSGIGSPDFFSAFPEIDFVIAGEGEIPLAALAGALTGPGGLDAAGRLEVPGLFSPRTPTGAFGSRSRLQDPADFRAPDYSEYFDMLEGFEAGKKFFPVLPLEMSRGCPRRAAGKTPGSKGRGCFFCNLNLQWEGYRSKAPGAVVSEIDALTSRHRLLSVAFADNLIPLGKAEKIFSGIEGLGKDLDIFCEISANTSEKTLAAMARAGARRVQIGIESLSSRLLTKMNKKTTAIQNLQIMRRCRELGIQNSANLITCFPGSDERDVEETLRALSFAGSFEPLKPVRFWLGLGGHVWQNPGDFGIRAVFPHPRWRELFPKDMVRRGNFIIQDFRGDKTRQEKLWRPVLKKIAQWEREYRAVSRENPGSPILSYFDGRDFLLIKQKKPGGKTEIHRLEKTARDIYLFCGRVRRFSQIARAFPGVSRKSLAAFLKSMTEKKLMFEEQDKRLSLAVPGFGKRRKGTCHEHERRQNGPK
ncbi:conserved hypothetical protein [Candidatus Desulfarcum epimagneticum]|uniref:B12-binding domain-containing protein n=1 Tax=uncultured Desulfobacteraceae bacterium TaxID=218296 RepID=A0A484HE50_9BACT|nr:conserved hypothetical protein [uncultured Desulfobacteraceae bacterium]